MTILSAEASTASAEWGAWRLIIGGSDVTFFRGYPAQIGSITYEDPWGYGPASFVLPGVTYWDLADKGAGELAWWGDWSRVVLERVKPDSSVETLWRGYIGQQQPGGPSEGLTLACPGEAQGRLSQAVKVPRPFAFQKDLGRMLYDQAKQPGLPIRPLLGLTTGIMLDERSRSGGSGLDACNELLSLGQRADGAQMTIMPTDAGTYLMQYRDEETIHATVFLGAYGVKPELTSNLLDRPTTIYAVGRFPDGGLYANFKAPGFVDDDPGDFPGTISSSTSDADLVNDWQSILSGTGYLTRDDALGGFNAATVRATKELQEDAGLPQTGVVNEATWNAAFDRDVTGVSLAQAHCHPFAQLPAVRKYNYTPSGARIGTNDDYDEDRPAVEELDDMGVYPKPSTREWAKARVQRLQAAKMWAGTLRLNDKVSLFAGDYHHGDPDPEVVHWMTPMAGWNIMFRGWDGDTLLHVAVDAKDENGATLTVDSMGRPALEVKALVERRAEGKRHPARTFERQHKGVDTGGIGEWIAELGGEITRRVVLPNNTWKIIPVIAGDEGQIEKTRLKLVERRAEGKRHPARTFERQHKGVDTGGIGEWIAELGGEITRRVVVPNNTWKIIPVIAGDEGQIEKTRLKLVDAREFSMAWFAKPVTAAFLNATIGDPFDSSGWDKDAVHDAADARILLYSAGDNENPCGYRGREKAGHTLSGVHVDAGGFPYRTYADEDVNNGKRGLLYLAVRVRGGDTAIRPQRVLWPAYEVGM